MPTENRSSNTEMVSVPPYIGLEPLAGRYYPAQCRRCGWVGSSEELTEDDAQCTRDVGDRLCLGDCDELERHDLLNIIQAMASPHPEPIAWMVGTALWWTKEEAERDAEATGLPIVGLGLMAGADEAERLRDVVKHSDNQIMRQSLRISNQRTQLADRLALLREALEFIDDGVGRSDAEWRLIKKLRAALSPDGAAGASDEPYQGMPGTSFQRLNALANQGE